MRKSFLWSTKGSEEGAMSEELIQMSRREMERLPIIHWMFDRKLKQKKATEMIGVTD